MYRLLLIIILFLFSCDTDSTLITEPDMTLMSMEQNTINPGDLPWPMIVGGTQVDPACPDCKYPFMVSVQWTGNWGGHYCGGSLVREDWVITAAHCMTGESTSGTVVKIGLHNVNGTTVPLVDSPVIQ
jgi:secreted trypsin-like serine protease